jgi:hypothetical protein
MEAMGFLILFQGHPRPIAAEEVEEFLEQIQRRAGTLEQGGQVAAGTGVTQVMEMQQHIMAVVVAERATPMEPQQLEVVVTKE